jgi:hypothetical protein
MKGFNDVRREYKSNKLHTQRGRVDIAIEVNSEVPTFIEFKQLYLDFPRHNDCLENPFKDLRSLGSQNAHRFAIVLARLLVEGAPLCIPSDQVYKLPRELKYGAEAFERLDELFRKRALEHGGHVYPDRGERKLFRIFAERQIAPSLELYAWIIRIDKA